MATFSTKNPATGDVLAELEIATPEQVKNAVEKAQQALPNWKALSFKERAYHILKARDRILQSLDDIAELITKENGKPLTESISADILPVMELATYYAKDIEKILQKDRIWLGKWNFMGRTSEIEYHPLGAIGIIAPWNYPFSIPCGQVIMALLAGNTVVLKPSEFTSLIGLKIQEIFDSVGLPEGVLQTVVGDGTTGAALVNSGVKKYFLQEVFRRAKNYGCSRSDINSRVLGVGWKRSHDCFGRCGSGCGV
ncbi:MAG: aldehyde dehydrogenase family protein [Deltaproteobacteria bacterium]|nr:MAG: aldehyde dehydrogenase family protein [Deltaproteobacteria bacterium]